LLILDEGRSDALCKEVIGLGLGLRLYKNRLGIACGLGFHCVGLAGGLGYVLIGFYLCLGEEIFLLLGGLLGLHFLVEGILEGLGKMDLADAE